MITAGIDAGSSAVKVVVMDAGEPGRDDRVLAAVNAKIRKRDVAKVVREAFDAAAVSAGVSEVDYVATTGEGEEIDFATGHFYGMTTHARGALFLEPRARAVLDAGALHARAVTFDERGRVLTYKMTSQCASGSGQFLENIARYLGVSQAEIGGISRTADAPEAVSSICAVLAETDVINMVSRGISTPNILRGIHDSMAGRFARLLVSLGARDVFVSGGLATDEGLLEALRAALEKTAGKKALGKPAMTVPAPAGTSVLPSHPGGSLGGGPAFQVRTHPQSVHAGAIGAAIWGAFRRKKLDLRGAAWKLAKAS